MYNFEKKTRLSERVMNLVRVCKIRSFKRLYSSIPHHSENCGPKDYFNSEDPSSNTPVTESVGNLVNISSMDQTQMKKYFDLMLESCRESSPEQFSMGLRAYGKDNLALALHFTLHSLNVELASIKNSVTNPSTSLMRLNWWKTALKDTLRSPIQSVNTPPLIALACLNQLFSKETPASGEPFSIRYSNFRGYFKSRESDLQWKQPPTLSAVETYAENIYSHFLYTQIRCVMRNLSLDVTARSAIQKEAEHAASHLGKCYGMIQLLRGTPIHAQNSMTYLPADLCAKHGVSEDMIYNEIFKEKPGSNAKETSNVVFELADTANTHLKLARSLDVTKELRPTFWSSFICQTFLDRLEKADFNIYDPSLTMESMRLHYLYNLYSKPLFGTKF